MLEVQELQVAYGHARALWGVSFELRGRDLRQREVHFQLLGAGGTESHRLDTVAEHLGAKVE